MSTYIISEGTQISSGTYTQKMNAQATIGCFATPTPLVDHGSYIYQSSGNCQKICYQLGMPVMGMTSGTNCSCGELIPPKDGQVDDSECSTPCVGYDKESCGGADLWWVILTGQSQNQIGYFDPQSVASSSSSSSTKSQASVVTVGGSTVFQTVDPAATENVQGASTSSSSKHSSGTNTVGIAVGVVVGVLVLAALIGGVFLFLRRRQSKLAQAEYEQKQSVEQFVTRSKGYSTSQTSANDSRLDPEVMMSRRQSDGSIMDNQDYSRRILKVTN